MVSTSVSIRAKKLLGFHEEILLYLKAVGRIAVTLGKFDEISNDLTAINQKCMQWFLQPKVGKDGTGNL